MWGSEFTTKDAALQGGFSRNDQVPAMHNERRRGKRPGRNGEVPATHNERRREQGLGATIKYLVNQNAGAGNNWAKAHI